MSTLSGSAPAKLNLTLRVTGVRADRFHEIESLVARIDLCDTLTVAPHEDGCYALDCDDPALPRDGSNLVLQAARALARTAGVNPGARLVLAKRIPAGAGLGGGSSDAATALRLLNQAWGLGLPPAELERVGGTLGSDVPLFFHGPLCIIRGRGEEVEDVRQPLRAWAALVLGGPPCPTAAVYAAWDRRREHPARPGLGAILAALGAPERLMGLLYNDLEEAALAAVPGLRELAAAVAEAGGAPVRLTGSGSGLYRLFGEEAAARRFAAAVRQRLGVRVEVVAVGAA